MSTMERWIDAVCAEFGLDPAEVDFRVLLDVAGDVAHGVARPAAPVTTYLLGLAVGRGEPAGDAMARLRELAKNWDESPAAQD